MLFLREAVAVKRKEIAALEKNLEYTRTRYREGVATRFDLLSTEVRLASAMTKKPIWKPSWQTSQSPLAGSVAFLKVSL